MAKRAERFLTRVAERVAVKYGLEVVRGFLLKELEPITPDHLYQAIKEGTHVWLVAKPKHRRRGLRWARRKAFRKHKDELTPDIVLRWLSLDRPDLASLIVHMPDKKGIKWLKAEVEDIKSRLWPET